MRYNIMARKFLSVVNDSKLELRKTEEWHPSHVRELSEFLFGHTYGATFRTLLKHLLPDLTKEQLDALIYTRLKNAVNLTDEEIQEIEETTEW
jgi:hypothetical protein